MRRQSFDLRRQEAFMECPEVLWNTKKLNEIQRIRFEARIDFVRDFMTEEQLQQLRRYKRYVIGH